MTTNQNVLNCICFVVQFVSPQYKHLRTSASNLKRTLEALEVLLLKGWRSIRTMIAAYPWGYNGNQRNGEKKKGGDICVCIPVR